jgi:hypothetical protein
MGTVVDLLHCCKSDEQMKRLLAVLEPVMVTVLGEPAYFNWLKMEYCSEPWLGWRIGGSGIPGVPSSNQPQESWHLRVKTDDFSGMWPWLLLVHITGKETVDNFLTRIDR